MSARELWACCVGMNTFGLIHAIATDQAMCAAGHGGFIALFVVALWLTRRGVS